MSKKSSDGFFFLSLFLSLTLNLNQKKVSPARLALLDRKASVNRTSPGRFQTRPKSTDRFSYQTMMISQPRSPSSEQAPLNWFIRDIDIGDGKSDSQSRHRNRSRHECHFDRGTPFLSSAGGKTSS